MKFLVLQDKQTISNKPEVIASISTDSNLEMSWFTFGGEYHELYNAIIIAWCIKMNIPTDEETLSKYFKLHLERGISHLSGTNFIKNLDNLVNLSLRD